MPQSAANNPESPAPLQQASRKIRVLVVDDSDVIVQLLLNAMDADEELEVVGVGRNGEEAVQMASHLKPDIITMDIVMPRLDGLSAIRRIMSRMPVPIVVLAALSSAEVGFEAIQAGALTVVEKPTDFTQLAGQRTIANLLKTLKLMAGVKLVTHRGRGAESRPARTSQWKAESSLMSRRRLPPASERFAAPRIIAIAASTGGPPALLRVLSNLPPDYPVPILIVQHIAEGFATGLVQWLDSVLKLRVVLARYDEVPRAGTVYIAPDNQHLMLGMNGKLVLSNAPPIQSHRPSANLLFESVGQCMRDRAVGIVLTGMGADGADGLAMLGQSGGTCVAQAEESCVVFGMPRAAIEANVVHRILQLEEIAEYLQELGRAAVRDEAESP